MITVLTGDNSFEITRELQRLRTKFSGESETIDGSELELSDVSDLLMGQSLFATKRLVIIKNLSENKAIWTNFSDWLDKLSDQIQLVLVEPKTDKRMRTYKDLQKQADVKEFTQWTLRDMRAIEAWVTQEVKILGYTLSPVLIRRLIERTGSDQWRLLHALEKLSVLGDVTADTIDDVVEPSLSENVFMLFETALKGDTLKIRTMIRTLELTEDPFGVFGLLSSQAFQLAVLATSDKPSSQVAKDISAHPYVLSKLSQSASLLGRSGASKIITIFSDADAAMKSSVGEPWLLIERALIKTATV